MNIDVNVFYDTDLARINFDKFITKCNGFNVYGDELIDFTDWNNYKFKKSDLINLIENDCAYFCEYSTPQLKRLTIEQLKNEISECLTNESNLVASMFEYLNPKFKRHNIVGYCPAIITTVYSMENVSNNFLVNLFYGCPITFEIQCGSDSFFIQDLIVFDEYQHWDCYTKERVIEQLKTANTYLGQHKVAIINKLINELPNELQYH